MCVKTKLEAKIQLNIFNMLRNRAITIITYRIQDAKVWFLFVGIDKEVFKARKPMPGFVIVNTDDEGDNKKHGAGYYEGKKKRDEMMKMIQRSDI